MVVVVSVVVFGGDDVDLQLVVGRSLLRALAPRR